MLKRILPLVVAALVLTSGGAIAQGKEKVVLLLNWYTYS